MITSKEKLEAIKTRKVLLEAAYFSGKASKTFNRPSLFEQAKECAAVAEFITNKYKL